MLRVCGDKWKFSPAALTKIGRSDGSQNSEGNNLFVINNEASEMVADIQFSSVQFKISSQFCHAVYINQKYKNS